MLGKLIVSAGAATIALATGAAIAQQASAGFSDIDTSGDGYIDYSEAEAVFGTRGADGLFRNDTDGDGLLSAAELIDGGSAVDEDGNVLDEDGNVVDGASSDVDYEDLDRGHGNDPDGFDEDNPGRGHDTENGERGGGNANRNDNGNGNGRDEG